MLHALERLIDLKTQLIMGHTVRSSNFLIGSHTAQSGVQYSFQSNGTQWTVFLGNLSANIVQSDDLTWNGVIHWIDNVLFDVSNTSDSTNGSLVNGTSSDQSSSSTQPAATSSTDSSASTSATSSTTSASALMSTGSPG